jgi:hypothetical protein
MSLYRYIQTIALFFTLLISNRIIIIAAIAYEIVIDISIFTLFRVVRKLQGGVSLQRNYSHSVSKIRPKEAVKRQEEKALLPNNQYSRIINIVKMYVLL